MKSESKTGRFMKWYASWRASVFLGCALACAGVLAALLGANALERVEIGSAWLYRLFGASPLVAAKTLDHRVEIVGFDKSAAAEKYGDLVATQPVLRKIVEARGVAYDRAVYAAVLDKLVAAGAGVVVFDFVFEGPGPTPEGDRAFAEAIARHHDKVVFGFAYNFTERAKEVGADDAQKTVERREPCEDLLPEKNPDAVLGFVDVWPDMNGAITHMVAREDRVTLARPELAARRTEFEDMSLTARAAAKLGAIIPADNATRLINYAGPARTFRMTPVQDLFTPDRWAVDLKNGARFKGKAVVVGPYSEVHYKDAFATPYGMMLGVEIQANSLQNYLDAGWLRRPLDGWMMFALATPMLAAVWAVNTLVRSRRVWLRPAIVLVGLGAYACGAAVVFARAGVFLPVSPVLAAAGLAVAYGVLDFLHTQYERSRIKGMFGTYLSPEIVNRMVASGEEPKLGGEQVRLTAFFSDVQSFSSFSEILTPEQLVEIMNLYLGAMTDILEEDRGTLDKYIGDAIVAMFGAPIPVADHAHRACACALRMQKRLGELRAEWAAQGDKWPRKIHAMRMRIGLNTGPATVGNMGSAKRFNYTMMGDTVNLAARCESGAKSAGVYTLVTEETVVEARRSTGRAILFRKADKWKVKGRSTAVTLYEAVSFEDEASAETRECVRLYEAALEHYFAGKFAEAKALFEQSLPLEPLQPGRDPGVEHNPSEILLERCGEFLDTPPPADWDGVYVMKSK